MKNRIVVSLLALLFTSVLSGCIVHTPHHNHRSARSCGPAHHWDGKHCVHNGKHKGHHKR